MGFYSDLMGFYSDSMGYEWDIPSGKLTCGTLKIANFEWKLIFQPRKMPGSNC